MIDTEHKILVDMMENPTIVSVWRHWSDSQSALEDVRVVSQSVRRGEATVRLQKTATIIC